MQRKTPLIVAVTAALVAMAVYLAVTAWRLGVTVVVRNSDPTPITNVRVSMGGTTLDLGTIAAGATASGRAIPVADSDVGIEYTDTSGTKRSVRIPIYITGGYRGRVHGEIRDGALVSSDQTLY